MSRVVRTYAHRNCVGCGMSLADGYSLGCAQCANRRSTRLKRGELFTETGIAGERIDNRDPRGRLVAA